MSSSSKAALFPPFTARSPGIVYISYHNKAEFVKEGV